MDRLDVPCGLHGVQPKRPLDEINVTGRAERPEAATHSRKTPPTCQIGLRFVNSESGEGSVVDPCISLSLAFL